MRISKLLCLIVVLLSSSLFSFAQKVEWKEATSGGYKYKYVTTDATNARFYTLKNGLTVILSPTPKDPRIQTYISIKAGSKTDPATNTGLAHYLEHMLFKGTDKFGSLDWQKEKVYLDMIDGLYEAYNRTTDETKRKDIYHKIDSVSGIAAKFAIPNEYDNIMASMGAKGTNAWTSFEETVYTEDVPSNVINKYLAVQSERFRNPILRIFHTELEAVYEEKNRGLDNDGRKSFEAMFAALFPNNNYGKQTTIGTIEHLKNPSLVEIRKYFNNYYVPNNMGIIMSGDFNPDEVIKEIDNQFGKMVSKPVPAYTFDQEKPITSPIVRDVVGPEPENIMMGFRFPGASHKDAQILDLVGKILTNGTAGLIDLNLVQKQKLLGAYAFPYLLKDYSMLLLQGMPAEGQSLDEVKSLILGELAKLKSGEFSEELLKAIINNEKKSIIEVDESYSGRARELQSYFSTEIDWKQRVEYTNALSKITKQDIIQFAKKYLNDNYVAIYKKQGEDKSIVKVEKPTITPIHINKDKSAFAKSIEAMPENVIQPVWLDYKKDMQNTRTKDYEIFSVQNKDNSLFRLYYQYETGSWTNKYLPLAADYINYIGTKNKSAEQFSKDMYNLAASFNISVGAEVTNISIDGLNENFDNTVALVEDLINNAAADKEAFEAYKVRLKKARENAKKNKGQIMRGLQNYAQYGAANPFNNVLSDRELENLQAEELVVLIKSLFNSNHIVVYYGPEKNENLAKKIGSLHKPVNDMLKGIPNPVKYKQVETNANTVLFTHYDMVQAELTWIRNAGDYNANIVPTVSLFNEYYGGGMGSIVFQTIRESKALAYSTYAYFGLPNRQEYKNTIVGYVGTQSDKLTEAATAMQELLNELPQNDKNVITAKDALRKSLATQRITQESIVFNYLNARKMGRDFDIRKNIYEAIPTMDFQTLQSFHNTYFKNKHFTHCVLGNKDKISMDNLQKLGTVKQLSLEEIFGY